MRKDLLASLTSKIAVGVAAVLLTAGTGGAIVFSNANHESPGPNENANEHATENVNDDHESDDEATNDVESEDEANANSEDNHGADVRVVAQDKDAECDGTHGWAVSAMARGISCSDIISSHDAGATASDDASDSAESNGKSDEDHGKSGEEHPPADAGDESSDDED